MSMFVYSLAYVFYSSLSLSLPLSLSLSLFGALCYALLIFVRPNITADVVCSLNFRPFQYMVKNDVDLAAIPLWYAVPVISYVCVCVCLCVCVVSGCGVWGAY